MKQKDSAGTLDLRVPERGWALGRGVPGDWQRPWAGREGQGEESTCAREKLRWGPGFPFLLLLPPLPHLPSPSFPLPSFSSSSGSGCSFPGQRLTYPELSRGIQRLRARVGTPAPRPPGGRGRRERARRGPRTRAVSPAGAGAGEVAGGATAAPGKRSKGKRAALKGAGLLLPPGKRLEGKIQTNGGNRRSQGKRVCGWGLGAGGHPGKLLPSTRC